MLNDVSNVDEFELNAAPNVGALYQSTTDPAAAVALTVIDPSPHLSAFTAVGTVGFVFTVAITSVRLAEIHAPAADDVLAST